MVVEEEYYGYAEGFAYHLPVKEADEKEVYTKLVLGKKREEVGEVAIL